MADYYQELSLRDYWRVVVRRKWLVVAAVVACTVGALGMSALQKPVYEAEARMAVRSLPGGTVFGSDVQGNSDRTRTMLTEIEVLESDLVYQRVKQNLGLTVDPPHVSGHVVGVTDIAAVSVRSGVPATAQRLADAYVQAYIDVKRDQTVAGLDAASNELQTKIDLLGEQIRAIDSQVADASEADRSQLEHDLAGQRAALVDQQSTFKQRLDQMQIDSALSSGGALLVEPASLPTDPVEPTPIRTTALALVVGLLLGLGAAFLIDYTDDSIRDSADLEARTGGTPVLSVVPNDPPPDNLPVAISVPDDPAIEAYRTLRTNLQFLGLDRTMRIIQITSSIPGEGKTNTAANLAVVLAQAGQKVILVDADLRRPRLHQVFGTEGTAGVTDALLGEPLAPLLIDIAVEGGSVALLPAGRAPANHSELLGGRKMKALLNELAESADFVIVDSAPLLPVTDSVVLTGSVEAVVMVAQSGRTTRKQITEAIEKLNRVAAPLVGVVMNRVPTRKLRYGGGGYGYGYGYGYGSTSGKAEPKEKSARSR
ncbi:polysaccharide biosynthesis tyrosine autokinase [soil metagenome]